MNLPAAPRRHSGIFIPPARDSGIAVLRWRNENVRNLLTMAGLDSDGFAFPLDSPPAVGGGFRNDGGGDSTPPPLRGWIVPVGDAIPDRRGTTARDLRRQAGMTSHRRPNPLAREVADIFIPLTRNENSAMTVKRNESALENDKG